MFQTISVTLVLVGFAVIVIEANRRSLVVEGWLNWRRQRIMREIHCWNRPVATDRGGGDDTRACLWATIMLEAAHCVRVVASASVILITLAYGTQLTGSVPPDALDDFHWTLLMTGGCFIICYILFVLLDYLEFLLWTVLLRLHQFSRTPSGYIGLLTVLASGVLAVASIT